MSAVVLDAGIGLALVVPLPYSTACASRFRAWLEADTPCYAPALWEYEVTSTLRKLCVANRISAQQQFEAVELVRQLGVSIVPPSLALHRSALAWAARLGHTAAYDGAYLALAEDLGAELWTADGRLARAAAQAGVEWVRTPSD